MGKDTVIDDLKRLDAETALKRMLALLARLNDVDRNRVVKALGVFFEGQGGTQ